MRSSIRFSYRSTNGASLHVAEAGPSEGPLVVLLKREHATHKGLPRNGTNDAVYCYRWNVERKGVLKIAHRSLCHRSEDAIYLRPFRRVARQVAELEFLLDPLNRISLFTWTTRAAHVAAPTVPSAAKPSPA
jgi:hypothetical protein